MSLRLGAVVTCVDAPRAAEAWCVAGDVRCAPGLLECLDACATPPEQTDATTAALLLQVLGGLASTKRFELLFAMMQSKKSGADSSGAGPSDA